MECQICLKKFSNAKAVGAHMKSHFAPLKLPNLTEPSFLSSSSSSSSSECQICLKKFSNAKAVGAHMKSHFAPLQPLPNKTPPGHQLGAESPDSPPTESASVLLLSASGEEDEVKAKAKSKNKKKKPLTKKLKQITDPPPTTTEFVAAAAGGDSVANSVGTKSDSESIGKKLESSSSLTEFELASCLMTLSRDVRVMSSSSSPTADSVSGDSDGPSLKTRYQCDVCKRYFQKSQGLGTHRKTHESNKNGDHGLVEKTRKKMKTEKKTKKNKTTVNNEQEVHECDYCDKVFASVFALAGHRRWHLALLGNVSDGDGGDGDEIRRCNATRNAIDLNLPPPVEDDEGGEYHE